MIETLAGLDWIGLETIWTVTAVGYGLAATHMALVSDTDYPYWIWGTFYTIGGVIFLSVNREYIFSPDSLHMTILELSLPVLVAACGVGMYLIAKGYMTERTLKEEYEEIIESHDLPPLTDGGGTTGGDDEQSTERQDDN